MVELPNPQLTECLSKIANGDLKAIEQIYRHYQATVFQFASHLVLDDHLANDIVQETFITVSNKPKRFDVNGSAKFSTWLCGIAKRKAQTMQRYGRKFIDDSEGFLNDYSNNESWSISHEYDTHELNEIINGCLDKLDEDQRTAAFWIHRMGMLQRDVAKIQGKPLNTIKTRAFYGVRKIRDCLSKLGITGSNN